MAQTHISHRRTHNLLLISKLLSLRDNASPLSLILDTLEQPAKPLLRECIRRANVGPSNSLTLCSFTIHFFQSSFCIYAVSDLSKLSKTHTILLSFETLRPPKGIDDFLPAWQIPPAELSSTLTGQIQSIIQNSSAKSASAT